MKELIHSLSKSNGDFIIQPFKGSGKGGQKRNKTMSACRIIHPDSGTVSECQEERSFEQNKKKAFERLVQKDSFKKWHKIEIAKQMGEFDDIESQVEEEMKNIKIEEIEYISSDNKTQIEKVEIVTRKKMKLIDDHCEEIETMLFACDTYEQEIDVLKSYNVIYQNGVLIKD